MNNREKLILHITKNISDERLAHYVHIKIPCEECLFKDDCRSVNVITQGMCEEYILSRITKKK